MNDLSGSIGTTATLTATGATGEVVGWDRTEDGDYLYVLVATSADPTRSTINRWAFSAVTVSA